MLAKISGAIVAAFLFVPATQVHAQNTPSQPLVTQPVNAANLAPLAGNTRAETKNPANDRGPVADTMPLPGLLLQLRRPAAQEQALQALIDQLHDPKSPNFHRWLTASEIGTRFGPAQSDIDAVTGWLVQQGFTVDGVYPNRMVIAFSGTAGLIRSAFHTEIHNLSVNGAAHFANMSDPQIPSALAPAVAGIVSLNDFRPRPAFVHNPEQSSNPPQTRNGNYWITPADLETIYNMNPVFASGNSGQNQTIYLIENTDLFNDTDWTTFRAAFGLSGYTTASLTTVHPAGALSCPDPGINGDDGEAALDVEYASAAAPGAALVVASCSGNGVGGVIKAAENLLNGASPPAIMSLSYIDCETQLGAGAQAALASAYQTGVAQGTSIFVSAGDELAGTCDYGGPLVTHGINANGIASTPYNVAVGGTDFADTYLGVNSTYWSATNSSTFGSALSYIPEIPWNSSCGSELTAQFHGYATAYGASGFCNSGVTGNLASDWGGSGGPSGCATGSPSIASVVSGSCQGYAKPSWQTGILGVPNDGVRDLPDVSLFSSFGPWKHGYVICFSDTSNQGTACSTTANTFSYDWGGTSFASPIWAGIQALVNQQTGQREGLPNYRLYQIAANGYGGGSAAACNSSGPGINNSCIFHDVTLGDIVSPCQADAANSTLYNCFMPGGTIGVVSTDNNSYAPAYKTTAGWDFATGIGTVNVANLVTRWQTGGVPLTATHDFNGDGKSDILWRDTAGDVALWQMNGGTVSSSTLVANVPTTWSVAGQRDFDGDGKSDILWRDSSGNVAIWLMNGDAVSSSVSLGSVPTTWSVAGTGDFNGDGKGDILWRDASGNVAVWLMNGGTVSSSVIVGNVPTSWSIAGSSRNGILWRDSSGNTALWVMNGGTVSQSISLGNVPASWSIVGTGDFDGDGNLDILWRDSSGNTAAWFLNANGAVSSSVSLGAVPTTWSVVETGDFNGDGKSDILWHDTGGNVAIWLMNGATVSSSTFVGSVPVSWSIQGAAAD